MNFAESLKEIRIDKSKTLLDVEKDTGINHANLSRWENGKVLPSIEFCLILAEYYDVSLDELVGREIATQSHVTNSSTNIFKSNSQSEIQKLYDELDEMEQAQVLSFAQTLAKYKKSSELSKKTNRNIS